jgi:hypothetical protein
MKTKPPKGSAQSGSTGSGPNKVLHIPVEPTGESNKRAANSHANPGTGSADGRGMAEPANEAMAMPRVPYHPPEFGDGTMVVAVNTETGPSLDPSSVEVYLGTLLGRVPELSVDQYKMGAAIADRTKFGIPPKLLAAMLGFKEVDDALCRSAMALLCSVLATTIGPLDIASLLFGFSNALHAHPAFASVVKDATWAHPYGEHTDYRMAEMWSPDDPSETPISGNKEGEQ